MSVAGALAPVGQPLPGASPGQAISRFWRGAVTFSGRASRSELWWAHGMLGVVALALAVPVVVIWVQAMLLTLSLDAAGTEPTDELLGLTLRMLAWLGVLTLVVLVTLLPALASMWRRLQDANQHGAWSLLALIGLGIIPLVLCCFPTNPAGIRFDPAYRAHKAAMVANGYAGQGGYGQAQYGQAQPGYSQQYGQAGTRQQYAPPRS